MATKKYNVRDFFRKPEMENFRLSPDGKWLSFMKPWKDRMNIYIQPLADGKPSGEPRRLTDETARDIAGYLWKGSGYIVYAKDFGGDENFHVVAVDINSGAIKDLTPFEKVRAGIIDELEEDPTDFLISLNKRDPKVFDVYRVNVLTGELSLAAQNPGNITGWVTDHDGKVRAAVTSDGVNTSLLFRDTETAEFKTVITTNFRETVRPLFFTFDNKKLYVSCNLNRDCCAIAFFDPLTAKEESILFEYPENDVTGLSYSRLRKVLTKITYYTDKRQQKYLDEQIAKIYESLGQKLPGYEIHLQSHTKNEMLWIVAAASDRTEGIRYLYNVKTYELTKLCEVMPWLDEKDMAPMNPIVYKSRDGLTIHGYLTLPVGRPAKNLPVIVNPHGGPHWRDYWGFNPETQFLANCGYAVFQPNFRGSTSYGRKFWAASFKQWGRSMQDDITDGVQWLIDQGIADPKQIGIYGGSYGGYATLAGITKTPELYAAAVDYVGVSNMLTFMNTMPPYWEPARKMLYEMFGDPEKDKEMLREVSPVFHVDRIRTPLFVAQGANDPRVNKAESDQIVEALRKRGVPVEYMVKDNEGHGFRNQENQFDFYEAMEKFFNQYLKSHNDM